jgi:hypothetical protein
MNQKRSFISDMESHQNVKITFTIDHSIADADFRIERLTRTVTNYGDEDSETKNNELPDYEKQPEEQKKEVNAAAEELSKQSSSEEVQKDGEVLALKKNKNNNHRRRNRTAKTAENAEITEKKSERSFSLVSPGVDDNEKAKIRGRRRKKRPENLKKEEKSLDSNSGISGQTDVEVVGFREESSSAAVFKVQAAKHDGFISQEEVSADAGSVRERHNGKKKKGWWQKLLKTPGDEWR